MTLSDMAGMLWQHTPYLLGGYAGNLLIAVLAMATGTALGMGLGSARSLSVRALRLPAAWLTSMFRNVPSFVLMFYVAFVMPAEFQWGNSIVQIPLWIKATIALIMPVIGFASDQFTAYLRHIRQRQHGARATFIVAWVQYFLIVLMASATASVIGADEVVSRANRVISFNNDPTFLLLTYGYVCLWFLLTGLLVSSAARALDRSTPGQG